MSSFQSFDEAVKKNLSFLDNEYVSAGLSLFLVLYAGLAAPKLPESVAKVFDNPIVKLGVFFIIVYLAKKNPTLALIASIGVAVSIMTLNTHKFNTEAMSVVAMESIGQRKYRADGCMCKCEGDKCTCECSQGKDTNIDEILPFNGHTMSYFDKELASFEDEPELPKTTTELPKTTTEKSIKEDTDAHVVENMCDVEAYDTEKIYSNLL
jgi:hypothetical protein